MRKGLITFVGGIVVGALLGALIRDEERKCLQKTLKRQADKLCKGEDNPIKEGVAKVKGFMKEHLQ